MWKELQKGWDLPTDISREIRDDCKNNKDGYKKYEVGWIGIGCCYNGIFFGGYAGEITTKTGIKRNYIKEAKRNVLKQLPKLEEVEFIHSSYQNLEIPKNSLIYCDPPYEGTAKYKTGNFNHAEFWEWCRNKTKEGHQVFISEYNAPKDFECVWSKEVKTTLNTSKIDTEKLFVYCG
jgi:DNA adenine methylase